MKSSMKVHPRDDETVALHATAALTAVSGSPFSSSRERRRSARTRSPSERGRFRRVKARHFPRIRGEQRLDSAREPVFPHTEVGTNRGPSSGSATDDVLRAFPGFALVIGVVAAVCRALVTMAAQRRD